MKSRLPNPFESQPLDQLEQSKRRERRRNKALDYLLAFPTLIVAFAATCWLLELLQFLYAPAAFPATLIHHAVVVGGFFVSFAGATLIFLDHQRFWPWRALVLIAALGSLVIAWVI